jgi:PAS domain S-box-containing protein
VSPSSASEASPAPHGAQIAVPEVPPARQGRMRFGIAGKLLLAFGTIAGLTVLATVVAWVLFNGFRDNLTLVTNRSLPVTITSFQLAETSAELGSALPRLASAATDQDVTAASKSVEADIRTLANLVADLAGRNTDTDALAAFSSIVDEARENVGLLRKAVLDVIHATGERQDTIVALFKAHQTFLQIIAPLIDATRDDTLAATRRSVSEGTTRIGFLIDTSFEALRAVLEVQANINDIGAVLNQIAAVDDLGLVQDRRFAIIAPLARIRTVMPQIPASEDTTKIADISAEITELAFGDRNIFELREDLLRRNPLDAVSTKAILDDRVTQLNEARDRFQAVGQRLVTTIDGQVLAAASDAWRESERIVTRTQRGLTGLESILFLHSEVNRLVSILSEAGTAQRDSQLPVLQKEFRDRVEHIERNFRGLDLDLDARPLRAAVNDIIDIGSGTDSLFEVRARDLFARNSADGLVKQSQALILKLSESAQDIVDEAASAAHTASVATLNSLKRGELTLVAIAVISLVGAVLITWLYVLRRVIGRLTRLSASMNAIAAGNLETPVTVHTNDEVGDMAEALKVFRQNAIQRQHAEHALRASEERYALAFQGNADAVWDFDLKTGRSYYSDRYWTMLGYDREEIAAQDLSVRQGHDWTERVHPDDRAQVLALMQDHLRGKSETYEAVFRYRCKDGSWIWILSRGGALRDSQGQPYRMTGTHTDITERVRLEEELRQAKERAESALAELKAAQANLVQSEKMASLGQLTAGIAHEIKNPLNFVNNFSALSVDLIQELREELEKGRGAEGGLPEEVEDILEDLTLNLSKITEHGKRADSIVRGMLDHSRASTGTLQPTNLNALLKEFANLAYHGMRAQTRDFNVELKYDLDDSLGPVRASPQDLSRVIINIMTNAFHATLEKGRAATKPYHPEVSITSRRLGEVVEVRIRDNGTGMPESVRDKIFEPFFTTKATGEGTGLGLSISYDIVVQQHGGSLSVESEPGAYTEFIITLPYVEAQENDEYNT